MSPLLVATLVCAPDQTIPPELADALAGEMGDHALTWLAPGLACDIALAPAMTQEKAQEIMTARLDGLPIDHVIQPAESRRKKALIADMDSTMIDQECIDELAAEVGLKDEVAAITARAMNGEIEFESALRERVALLKGLPQNIAEKVIEDRITLAAGGATLIATMRANGGYCALVSGGFTMFTGHIANALGFDEHHANILEIENGKLTGKVREPILGADAKVSALRKVARERRLTPKDFIAVGDGANDLPMLRLAGSGVALHAKPTVAMSAQMKVSHGDLTSLLYIQGYRQEEFSDA